MKWLDQLKGDPVPWLLEPDDENPAVRYFTLTEILDNSPDSQASLEARTEVMSLGPVPAILDAQNSAGYWVESGPGYNPKYRGTVWQIIFLSQFGADGSHPKVKSGCDYVLANSRSKNGGFSYTGLPSGMIHCLQGNLIAALIELGWHGDQRLESAIDWLARSITGEKIAPSDRRHEPVRYLRSGNSGPGFLCSANNHLPCAWGATKAIMALSKVPESMRSESVKDALDVGVSFLFSRNPADADYPMGYRSKPNRSWFKFGYPIAYVTDVLQVLEVVTALGHGADQRLEPALELLLSKQNAQGRWTMDYTYNGKTWVDVEEKGMPSKWVTYRALNVLTKASS
jgi:hypothetical protein